MTPSNLFGTVIESPVDLESASKLVEYRYDVRLEVGDQPDGGPLRIAAIFHDLVKSMKEVVEKDVPIVILTAKDQPYSEFSELSSEAFQHSFMVDRTEGKNSKVVMGFKLRTTTTLYDIKQRLLKLYLVPHNIFMREQVGGFQNGLKHYMFGFLKQDHPDHPDQSSLKARFARITSVAWKTYDKEAKAKWKKEDPQVFYSDGIALPIYFSKERVIAEVEGKPKVTTYAIVVSTPKKYGILLRDLLDSAILGKKLNNLIPFAFSKEDSAGYYQLVAEQERFMEQHRNIPIMNVPPDAPLQKGLQGKTLDHVLNAGAHVMRVAYDPKNSRYHVSTVAHKYREVHEWITAVLEEHQFPFNPTIRPMKFTTRGGGTSKYAAVFADAISVANSSFDASTVKTTKSNAWKQRPPLDISYNPTVEAFPPLPQKARGPVTPSTSSETYDEDTIQSAISQAIKIIQEEHRQELDKLKKEMQQKMDEMESQMRDLGHQVATQTYQALMTDDSPLATKTDHAKLQHDMNVITTQLTTIISMMTGTQVDTVPPMLALTNGSPPRTMHKRKTISPAKQSSLGKPENLSSATSDSDMELEGCEE